MNDTVAWKNSSDGFDSYGQIKGNGRNTINENKYSIKLNQFRVVLWKNAIIRKRHWLLAILEALLPIMLFLLIAYGRSKITGLRKTEVTEPTHHEINKIQYIMGIAETNILYSPENEFTSDIIQRMLQKFQMPSDQVFGSNNVERLLENHRELYNSSVVAIIFDTTNIKELIYTIRYHDPDAYEDQLPCTIMRYDMSSYYTFTPSAVDAYLWKGFVPLQAALDLSFVERSMGIEDIENNVTLYTQEFPYPPHKVDSALSTIFMQYLPLLTLFSFIILCPAVLKRVVEEKHSGTKELLKMVGMKSWMIWLGWFIYAIIPVLFSIGCIVFLMKIPLFGSSYPPIEHTSAGILIVFLLLYCTAAISFCFAISSCFNKPSNAVVTGILMWIFSYFVPKYSLSLDECNTLAWLQNILFNLLPNMTLHYGYLAISVYEEREIGVQWNNFGRSSTGGIEDVTMLNVFVMLSIDIVIYLLFTLYMDVVYPGKYGIKKSMDFPVKYLWRLFKKKNNVYVHSEAVRLQEVEGGNLLERGIIIRDLRKRYGPKLVVDIDKLDIYRNHITVLLGHNGAGKSTTMSMITGMVEPTSGTIKIDGLDSRENQDAVRKSIGLCPQHDLLFTDLTVREHLIFFAKLKGKSCEEAEEEMNELLERMNMSEKKNVLAHTLSGGMKRKLCLGMALIGGSKVLILDEPSSGMDPESRRQLWDLLLSWRGEKTILISTHFMEEADALGDWIAIMSEGSVQCYGTPMALKKEYHTGYHLSLIVDGDAGKEDRSTIKELVRRIVGGSQFKSENGNEMVFVLPFEEKTNMTELLGMMEKEKGKYKIENLSISITTMEDVFLKTRLANESDHSSRSCVDSSSGRYSSSQDRKNHCTILKILVTLFQKRFLCLMRKKCTYILPAALAWAFVLTTLYLTSDNNGYLRRNDPKLQLELSNYRNTSVIYNVLESDVKMESIRKHYNKLVQKEGSTAFYVASDVEQAIITKSMENIAYYRKHMVASASFFSEDYKIETIALYNAIAVHSLPISVNLVTNAIAKTLLGTDYSISASIWPLAPIDRNSSQEYSETNVVLIWLISIPIGCLLIHGSFIIFPHMEISTKFVQMQYMCGVKPYLYWITNLFTDLLVYSVFIFVMSVTMCLFFPPIHHFQEFSYLFLILLIFGLSGIPYSYLFSRKGSASGAFALFVILGIFLGVILTLIVGVLLESQDDYYIHVGKILKYASSFLVPQVGLSISLVEFCRRALDLYNLETVPKKMKSICSYGSHPCCDLHSLECTQYKDYMYLLEDLFVTMLASCIFYLVVVIFMDSYTLLKMWSRMKYKLLYYIRINKTDEKELPYENNTLSTINSSKPHFGKNEFIGKNEEPHYETNTLNANSLSKTYSGNQIVNNIVLTLKNRQCMGILGVNGAGKTTTFKLLTREEVLDEGSITIKLNEELICVDEDKYIETLGYCPQSDNLNYVLTGRQILSTIADLRGINEPGIVEEFLELFSLKDIADKPCGYYSGGNKRKLSLAVSLIGYRKFILLDEPTNGVDPSARRKCWNIIKDMQDKKNLSFILTSHSMAECEALCDELKIMKGGEFVVANKLSVLKKEFGGYSLKIKLKNKGLDNGTILSSDSDNIVRSDSGVDEVDGVAFSSTRSNDEMDGRTEKVKGRTYEFKDEVDLKNHFTKNNRGEIKDEHSGLLSIYVKDEGEAQRWSKIFEEVETIKRDNPHLIEDFLISEASLEDVFLKEARAKNS